MAKKIQRVREWLSRNGENLLPRSLGSRSAFPPGYTCVPLPASAARAIMVAMSSPAHLRAALDEGTGARSAGDLVSPSAGRDLLANARDWFLRQKERWSSMFKEGMNKLTEYYKQLVSSVRQGLPSPSARSLLRPAAVIPAYLPADDDAASETGLETWKPRAKSLLTPLELPDDEQVDSLLRSLFAPKPPPIIPPPYLPESADESFRSRGKQLVIPPYLPESELFRSRRKPLIIPPYLPSESATADGSFRARGKKPPIIPPYLPLSGDFGDRMLERAIASLKSSMAGEGGGRSAGDFGDKLLARTLGRGKPPVIPPILPGRERSLVEDLLPDDGEDLDSLGPLPLAR